MRGDVIDFDLVTRSLREDHLVRLRKNPYREIERTWDRLTVPNVFVTWVHNEKIVEHSETTRNAGKNHIFTRQHSQYNNVYLHEYKKVVGLANKRFDGWKEGDFISFKDIRREFLSTNEHKYQYVLSDIVTLLKEDYFPTVDEEVIVEQLIKSNRDREDGYWYNGLNVITFNGEGNLVKGLLPLYRQDNSIEIIKLWKYENKSCEICERYHLGSCPIKSKQIDTVKIIDHINKLINSNIYYSKKKLKEKYGHDIQIDLMDFKRLRRELRSFPKPIEDNTWMEFDVLDWIRRKHYPELERFRERCIDRRQRQAERFLENLVKKMFSPLLVSRSQRAAEIGRMGHIKDRCPHCGKESNRAILTRWHFDKCPHKLSA